MMSRVVCEPTRESGREFSLGPLLSLAGLFL